MVVVVMVLVVLAVVCSDAVGVGADDHGSHWFVLPVSDVYLADRASAFRAMLRSLPPIRMQVWLLRRQSRGGTPRRCAGCYCCLTPNHARARERIIGATLPFLHCEQNRLFGDACQCIL